ncbi:cyclase [Rhodococcoides trifolii]|uniref:Cyclase n=1 Tax=Rhodococcoides trifolii TaxID=908250 RepID=A0A917G0R4_9NOCA|nr:SRPBCC family protein [Rhodococcus trifolii]GGG17027.1 cyclase [Rhodococcus trifolii]
MAVSDSKEIDIEADKSAVLDVIADLEGLPSWSSIHKKVKVVERTDDGLPKRAEMTISLLGVNDDQVLEYTWSDDGVTWEMIESSQQKSQTAEYRLTEKDGKTHVFFEMTVDLKVPMPGFLVKKGTKSVLQTATEGLREQVVR